MTDLSVPVAGRRIARVGAPGNGPVTGEHLVVSEGVGGGEITRVAARGLHRQCARASANQRSVQLRGSVGSALLRPSTTDEQGNPDPYRVSSLHGSPRAEATAWRITTRGREPPTCPSPEFTPGPADAARDGRGHREPSRRPPDECSRREPHGFHHFGFPAPSSVHLAPCVGTRAVDARGSADVRGTAERSLSPQPGREMVSSAAAPSAVTVRTWFHVVHSER